MSHKSLPDHPFTTRHLGLCPSAFLFAISRGGIIEVKPPEKLYCRIHRENPAAPKSPVLRFIHSVFQSPWTLFGPRYPAVVMPETCAKFPLERFLFSIPGGKRGECKLVSVALSIHHSASRERSCSSQEIKSSQSTCQKLIWNRDFMP